LEQQFQFFYATIAFNKPTDDFITRFCTREHSGSPPRLPVKNGSYWATAGNRNMSIKA
jgi:hypothetical protein